MIIDELREKLWNGANPFGGFPIRLIAEDTQGWSSQHPYLTNELDRIKPSIIVEVGVWKGGSTLTMAHKIRDLGIDAAIVAVDTWLGAWDHWLNSQWRQELCLLNGYPRLFEKFAANIAHHGMEDIVVPLPLDSVNARHVISSFGIVADIIHIDGAHDYTAVMTDLTQWWPALRVGGTFIGDDYFEDGKVWPDVFRAINDFMEKTPHIDFEFHDGKCRATKT